MTNEEAAALEALCRRVTPADREDIAKFLALLDRGVADGDFVIDPAHGRVRMADVNAWLERREAERAT